MSAPKLPKPVKAFVTPEDIGPFYIGSPEKPGWYWSADGVVGRRVREWTGYVWVTDGTTKVYGYWRPRMRLVVARRKKSPRVTRTGKKGKR